MRHPSRRGPSARPRRARRAAALVAAAMLHPFAPAHADVATPTALRAVVYLPDGTTPAAAAVVQVLLADPTGAPIPGTAFAQEVTAIDGSFRLDPPERPDLVAAAEANGGRLPVAVQIGDLAPHGSIDPNAGGGRLPDLALFVGSTTLAMVEDSQPDASESGTSVFGLPGVDVDLRVSADDVTGMLGIFLSVAGTVEDAAQVAGMFTDPDLVAGNDDVNDPDLVPPLGAIMTDAVPVPDVAGTQAGPQSGGVGSVEVSTDPGSVAGLIPEPQQQEEGGHSCFKDPGTYWVGSRHGNNPEGTKTYAYLDTFSCSADQDKDRDEVIYKWGGYTGGADYRWSIVRLKFRTEINDKQNYHMKYPDPVGSTYTGDDGEKLTWMVGFDYFAQASVGGSFHFKAKKIHGWQADGTGRLYHVSWVSGKETGRWGEGFNNGGGVNLDVPEGSDGRKGVRNNVIVWRCFWDPEKNYAATCGDRF